MEQKLVRVPFEVELAKKITNGEVEGKIVDNNDNIYRIVCFDLLDDKGRIIGLRKNDNYTEKAFTFNDNGFCVQNPSRELFIEIPEYMTFKDGDVLVNDDGNFMFLLSTKGKCKTALYASVLYGKLERVCDVKEGFAACEDMIEQYHKANDEQIKIFIGALKESKEDKAKEYLKRFFGIEQKQECEFKPFDKVLVRNSECEKWRIEIFSHNDSICKYLYVCLKNSYSMCIPYNERTAHLLGTTENWEE